MSNFDSRIQYLLDNGYEVRIGDYVNRGFEIFKQNIGGFLGFTLLIIFLPAIFNIGFSEDIASALSGLYNAFVFPPLAAGYYIMANKISKNESYAFNDFFKGLNYYVPLLLTGLVGGILTVLGFIALVIPGIYLAVAFSFAVLFVLFGGYGFWDALQASRKVVSKNFFSVFGFLIVILLINFAGLLVLCVGWLVTMPASYCMIYAAYEDIMGTDPTTDLDQWDVDILDKLD